MMSQPNTNELVQRWKALFDKYKTPGLTLPEKAELLRKMLAEIEYHRKLGRISEDCYEKLNKKFTKDYVRISANVVNKIEDGSVGGTEKALNSGKSRSEEVLKTVDSNSLDLKPLSSNSEPSDVQKPDVSEPDTVIEKVRSHEPEIVIQKVRSHGPELLLEKVHKPEISKPKTEQSLLNLWATTRKADTKDVSLISRPDKRKHVPGSPVSKKSMKSEEWPCDFLTAGEKLKMDQMKNGKRPMYQKSETQGDRVSVDTMYGKNQRSLGARRGLTSKFVPPVASQPVPAEEEEYKDPIYQDDRLKNCEPRMIELILNEILDSGTPMSWDDVAGLEFAKKTIQEIVVWPMLRPDIFTGLRGPPKGLLLFGPPGTGKTLIGKCIASQSNSTFFTISASSLTSKWIGEGEKMVRTLFAVARCHQPAVVFIDEIDSLLTQRSDTEHESSRRIKTEFLVQLDGACTASDERLLVIGATNRPQEIDEAARRRFVKRLYIPLPETAARCQIVKHLLTDQKSEVSDSELDEIGSKTDGYSGSDMANLCREAALGPIRSIPFGEIHKIAADDVRPIKFCDFLDALEHVKASVSGKDLDLYTEWNSKFGSGSR